MPLTKIATKTAETRAAAKPAPESTPQSAPFWIKPLDQLSRSEWERLCDGCGRCCMVKLEDEDTGDIHFTSVACKLFDSGACKCRDYSHRSKRVDDCMRLTPDNVETFAWLPRTCAYRLRAENKPLPDWHPLVSGDPNSVHTAGVSVRGRVVAFEDDVELEDLPAYIAKWPNAWPKKNWAGKKG